MEGRAWRDKQVEKVLDSIEYRKLKEILPGGNIKPDKLLGLIVWKEQNALD